MENRGIPLGFGVTCIKAWIPNKGFVLSNKLTNEEIKELSYNFGI